MRHLKNSLFWYIVIIVVAYLGTLFWGVIAQASEVPHTKSNCVITQEIDPDTMIVLREKMVCRDGYIGPSYWEIFAQFYYRNVDTPSYCRWLDRSDHVFHSPVKVCLKENGEWVYD